MTVSQYKRAIVLFAHGSRDPLWRKPMEAVALRIADSAPHIRVVCAYLELCAPTLQETAESLVNAGCNQISVVPMFLGVGKHAREDLPMLMDALRHEYTQTVFTLQQAVGEDPRLLDVLALIALEPNST